MPRQLHCARTGRNGRLGAQRFAANRRPRKARYDADFVHSPRFIGSVPRLTQEFRNPLRVYRDAFLPLCDQAGGFYGKRRQHNAPVPARRPHAY
jgi:hypothetical protein